MKKVIWAILVAATMVACAKEDVISQNNEAIGFKQAFVDNSVRSVNDPSFVEGGNMFTDFAVYGFVENAVLFDGTRVAQGIDNSELSSDWKYEGTQYWIAGANYNFNAVAPLTNGGWTKTDAVAASTTLSFTNNGTTDLLYAYASQQGKVSGNAAVAFTFRHTLSKVKFSFTNGYNATNATIRVKNIQIVDAYKTANVVLDAASTWSDQANNSLVLNFGNVALTAEDNAALTTENEKGYVLANGATQESYNELLLIPGAGATNATVTNADDTTTTYSNAYTVKFTVELLVSGVEVAEYEHTVYTTFVPEAGKSYDIAATITPENVDPNNQQEPIEFTVNALPGWGEPTEVPAN